MYYQCVDMFDVNKKLNKKSASPIAVGKPLKSKKKYYSKIYFTRLFFICRVAEV